MPQTIRTLAVAVAVALLSGAASAEAASVERGQDLAERNCSQCHAVGAKGESPNRMAPPFREVHLRYRPPELNEMFQSGLLTRHPSMPEFRFSLRELEDIAAYLESVEEVAEARLGRSPLHGQAR